MYEVDDLDRVVALDGVPQSCTGAPLPLVLADEYALLLGYLVSRSDPSWDGTYVRVVDPLSTHDAISIVRFELPTAHIFGEPNDEALEGHPLSNRGLGCYGAFEVIDSSWIRKLERMNAVHEYHDRVDFLRDKRHFIYTFHDTTFECVAEGYVVECITGTMSDALNRMSEILRSRWQRSSASGSGGT